MNLTMSGILNKRYYNVVSAGLSFGRTIFVCIVLTLGALMFSKDGNILKKKNKNNNNNIFIYFLANDIALRPIERMIEKVNKIAHNP